MRHRILALAFAIALPPQAAVATEPGYNIWFAGRVVSVDHLRGTLRIARGPTETAGPAIETCTMKRGSLKRIRRGMEVEAQADTHRHPWRILHLRIFERKHRAPQVPANA
ncbi:MAG: hypothetical protein NVS3B28_01350 [Candidatus Velthaea sp.]